MDNLEDKGSELQDQVTPIVMILCEYERERGMGGNNYNYWLCIQQILYYNNLIKLTHFVYLPYLLSHQYLTTQYYFQQHHYHYNEYCLSDSGSNLNVFTSQQSLQMYKCTHVPSFLEQRPPPIQRPDLESRLW